MVKVIGILGVAFGVFFAGTLSASVQLQDFTVDPPPPPPPAPVPTVPKPGVAPALGGVPLDTTSPVDSSISYADLVRSQSTVGALDTGLLGESIDYYTGQTDFVATDVSVPGNNALPVSVGRRYHVKNQAGGVLSGAFGDWDLEIPHVEGVVATATAWTVPGSAADARCNYFAAPPATTVTTPNGSATVTTTVPSSEYGIGYSIVVPGAGRHELLSRDPSNTQSPAGNTYPVVSRDWWASGCAQRIGAPVTNPPTPDEGFLVKSPDGVSYSFLQYSSRTYPSYQRPADSTTAGLIATVPRLQVFMLPTTITDRFGNWVSYTYTSSGATLLLSTITSSDGRTITLSYSGTKVSSITDGTRTWTYGYNGNSLSSVTLPDGSSWAINFTTLNSTSWTYTGTTCSYLPSPSFNGTASGTIRHPTGAFGTFTFTVTRQGRNNAPSACLSNSAGVQFAAVQPSVYDVLALTGKQISGPGISGSLAWTLAYAGCSSNSCNATKTTTVTDPQSHVTKYTFGAVYNANADLDTEGQLQTRSSGSGAKIEQFTYYTASGQAYPSLAGTPAQVRGDLAPLSTLRPTQTVTTTVDGASYVLTMSSPDAFGYPTSITHQGSSTLSDTLTYKHNTTAWVIGTLQGKVSGGATEWYATLNSYNQPTSIARFGRDDRDMSYGNDGTLQSVTDGDHNTTYYTDYKRGIPQSIVHPDHGSETVAVNNIGGVSTWVDTMGHQTSYGFDAMGRVNSITPPAGYHTTYIVWSTGSGGWTRTETRGNYSKVDTYDAFLRSTKTNENGIRIVNRTFDSDGHATFVSYPGSSSGTTSVYDPLGQLTSQTDGDSYQTTYTRSANAMAVKDRNGETTTYTYQTYDGPSTKWPTYIDGPIAATTIVRDAWGKPTSMQRGSVTRTLGYNSNQLLKTVTDPETGTTTYGYDGAANVTSINHNGAVTETRGYDPLNRLKSISYSNSDPSVAMSWRTDGQLDTASRGTVSLTRGYDGAGLVTSESYSYGSSTYDLSYAYDLDQHLTSLQYPDNTVVAYTPDANFGQPTTAGTYATGATYYPNGAIDAFTYGNGIAHTSSQEGRQLPYTVADAGVYSYKYGYDGNGNPTSITDQLGGTNTKTLSYDTGNRLHTANATNLWGNTTFGYDTQDNLTSDSTGSLSYTIDSSNRLSSATIGGVSTALSYDTRGNLSQKGTGATASQLTFDGAGHLSKVVQGTNTYSYSYDASGRRTSVITSATINGNVVPQLEVDSVYDAAGHLVYEATTTSPNPDRIFANGFEPAVAATTSTKYFYLGTHAVAKDSKNGSTDTLVYLHTDPLGSPIAQSNSSATVVGTTTYLPYGGKYSSTGASSTPGLGYANQYQDASGLIYMQARYYDPQLHRFISSDPNPVDASTALNFNRYSYAGNSPYGNIDPSGRDYYPYSSPSQKVVQQANQQLMSGNLVNAGLLYNANSAAVLVTNLYTALVGGDYTNAYTSQTLNYDERIGAPLFAAMAGLPFLSVEVGVESAASGVGNSIIGQSFGKLGTAVESPGLTISGFTEHGIDQTISRGVSPQSLLDTITDPTAVLQQSAGQYLYLSPDAGVVLSPDGQVITTYPSSMFDSNVQSILDTVGTDD